MKKEWHWKSRSGRAYFHAGVAQTDAVGTPQPGHDMPLAEGTRLLAAKGIDRIYAIAIVLAALRLLTKPFRKRTRSRRG